MFPVAQKKDKAVNDLVRKMVTQLLTLAGLILACMVGFHLAMRFVFDRNDLGYLAMVSGLIMGVALALGRYGVRLLHRRHMLGGAWGRIQAGGAQLVALSGRLEARDEPLWLPFVESPLLGAAYEVRETPHTKYEHRFRNRSGPRTTHLYMGGMLSTDAVLKLDAGDVPLLGPVLAEQFPQIKVPVASAAETILAHARDPGVNPQERPDLTGASAMLNAIGQQRHGAFRHEWVSPELADVIGMAKAGTTECDLELRHIPPGAQVSVVGLYDQAAGGLLPNPDSGLIEVFPGDAHEARSDMLKSAQRKLAMALFLLVFSLLVGLVVPGLVQI